MELEKERKDVLGGVMLDVHINVSSNHNCE